MIVKIDHIGIAVDNLDEAISMYENLFGLKCRDIEVITDQKVRVAFFNIGDTEIELLEPIDCKGPIANFINKKGQGIHHIAFNTDDIETSIIDSKMKGAKLIQEKPIYGAGGALTIFYYPKTTKGTLIEICQRKSKSL